VKPRRSALPLPRYVGRKPLRNGAWAHFFNPPTWARRAGCPVASEALGVDYDAAVKRAENVLLPAFDSWRSGGASDKVESLAKGWHTGLALCRIPDRPPLYQARRGNQARP